MYRSVNLLYQQKLKNWKNSDPANNTKEIQWWDVNVWKIFRE